MLRDDHKAATLKLLYVCLLVSGLIITVQPQPAPLPVYSSGQAAGTLALTAIAVQLVLASRWRTLERGIGLDRIMRWHSTNAKLIVLFVLLHPTLLFLRELLKGDFMAPYTIYGPDILGGVIGAVVIGIIWISVLKRKQLGLLYEHWRLVHLLTYFLAAIGLYHSLLLGSDIKSGRPLYTWWLLLAAVSVAAVVYRYMVRRMTFAGSEYEVVANKLETHDVHTITLRPVDGTVLDHEPGQFAFLTLRSEDIPIEEHPFTITSAPGQDTISFSIKESGDFTALLGKVGRRDTAHVEGPYGVFSNRGMPGPFVLIAGGIGITPLMSMLRAMHKDDGQQARTLLLYANRTQGDIAFLGELAAIERGSDWLRVVHILSSENIVGMRNGYVDGPVLKEEVEDLVGSTYFICGPPPMMDALRTTLAELGLPDDLVITERFAL
ncbi:MAG: ferredoxin reductase family protein [Methanopyri archaeon]|nr:ferredoxin reductase family protein [Methanopyri archaeon]